MNQDKISSRGNRKTGPLSLVELEIFLDEIDLQPEWRAEADRCADYYDCRQLDQALINELTERGQAPLVYNLIGPAIDGVLGMEAKTRTNWLVRADNDNGLEVAEGLNEELNEAARLAEANRGCSDAYAAQVKSGLGWVEVNRNTDPFDYDYRCQYVHRNEISWDWHTKRPDMKDCRYIVREKWLDEDHAIAAFPEHEDVIEHAVNGWSDWHYSFSEISRSSAELAHAYTDFTNSGRNELDWLDSMRKRICTHEVWYRRYVRGVVLKLPDGRVITYDKNNVAHKVAVAQGHVKPVSGTYPIMRLAYYIGPHRVTDIPSPLPHDSFPYIPFWGFREDKTNAPYGLIRRMLSPQDEINSRRLKMMWLLSAKRTILDEDATNMDPVELADEVQRPDAQIYLNPGRRNKEAAFKIEQDFTLAAQQFEVMKDAESMINSTSGIYQSLLGQSQGEQSGVAISSLVEQSSTTLAELNDNFRFARRMVGEQLLSMLIQDIGRDEREVRVDVNKPRPTRTITLNGRVIDEKSGHLRITNDVMRTKAKVVLDDIQATAGYRSQIANRLMDIVQTLPDDQKAAVMPIVIEATDIPQREEMVKVLNRLSGQGVDPSTMSEEERAAFAQQQAINLRKENLLLDEAEAKIRKMTSGANKDDASAGKMGAETNSQQFEDRNTEANTEKVLAEIKQMRVELNDLRDENELNRAMLDAYDAALPDIGGQPGTEL